jgi:nitroimidazol reductase NimA-like FMN-containing flavoprotein (pyridoxamine 5'-phosphate oxidase superfamily)
MWNDSRKNRAVGIQFSGSHVMRAKTTLGKSSGNRMVQTTVSRPKMPAEYGLPKHKKGLLAWSHVSDRMNRATHYWVCTVTPDGHPHATPVDGLWLEDELYFGGSPSTRWHRNLAANPAVNVHLESATDVVILRGNVRELSSPDRSLTVRLSKASAEKYGYAPQPEQYESGGVYVFRPSVVLAWKQFPKDATRWHLA